MPYSIYIYVPDVHVHIVWYKATKSLLPEAIDNLDFEESRSF